ncbi:MAG: DUF2797 domain-containing protein [Nitrospinae bacterium]|nr:DUF2797 domain-containing protein [Nitrospinota bacterium]
MKFSGQLLKMTHEPGDPVRYFLSLDEKPCPLNDKLGKNVAVRFLGTITCVECGRKIKKTYNDGYCFPCARDLPENALCSVRPEMCEHERGNERDREFFRTHCNIEHVVYLSLTSGVKVGVTRHFNVPSRWIDQGAVKALVIARTPRRLLSGKIEVALAANMPDKTNWRKMIAGDVDDVDLPAVREQALRWIPDELKTYALTDETETAIHYPVLSVPKKIASHNLDKAAEFSGKLCGVKGQYLIFQDRVINLRKYSGYHMEFSIED